MMILKDKGECCTKWVKCGKCSRIMFQSGEFGSGSRVTIHGEPGIRVIEKILKEQTDTKMERLVSTMQDQIRLLKKYLKEANEQIAAHGTAAPPVAAMVTVQQPLQPLNRLLPPKPHLPLLHATSTTTMGMNWTFLVFLTAE